MKLMKGYLGSPRGEQAGHNDELKANLETAVRTPWWFFASFSATKKEERSLGVKEAEVTWGRMRHGENTPLHVIDSAIQ